MRRLRILAYIVVALIGSQMILAQSLPPVQQQTSAELQRKVELMIRLKFDIPTACDLKIGQRTPSPFTGYDRLHVTISLGDRSSELEFLISKDNQSLARLENFDLDRNPALAIDIQGRPIRGNPDAPVTVINFDDLECPVCARMHQILKAELAQKYGDRVRFIYKDNPLVEIHPWAMHAAVDAGCLAQQNAGAYWSFVDYVHTHGEEVSGQGRDLGTSFSTLDRIAAEAAQAPQIDKPVLIACLKKQDETAVRQSMSEAKGLGLNFTPALLVNGELVRGITSLDDPARAVERALKQSK